MSWMQELYETYQKCYGNINIPDSHDLCPVGYATQNAHIEIIIDGKGNFRRSNLISKGSNQKTLIPVTESSAGRTSGMDPHPLCDSLQYCAKDYSEYGSRTSYFNGKRGKGRYENGYIDLLRNWAESQYSHPKVRSVYEYVKRGTVIRDLVRQGKLVLNESGKLKIGIKGIEDDSPIMKLLVFDDKNQKDQGKVFIRWVVEDENSLCSETWKDVSLIESWQNYLSLSDAREGLCCVSGNIANIAQKHPARIRDGKDNAKLISSNDNNNKDKNGKPKTHGYTFLGRFTSTKQAVGISFEITQKAHNTLRWLIGRKQAYKNETQVFIAWETGGMEIPAPYDNTDDFLREEDVPTPAYDGDAGEAYAERLYRKIAGYKAMISDNNNIVVMGLDSATTGRMSIIFYREFKGSKFLERIEKWHNDFAWWQDYGYRKDKNNKKKNISVRFIGAPAPRDIAWAAFGKAVEGKNGKKFMNATVERILPCIIDGVPFPQDIVRSAINRVSNRMGLKADKEKGNKWIYWEKCLGIACALYKGTHAEKEYKMALEDGRPTRDYLYGRLLAVADELESFALRIQEEKRDTAAARLMQAFSEHPFRTWSIIEKSLCPYLSRIKSKYYGMFLGYKNLLDDIHHKFLTKDDTENENFYYANDSPLNGEFLLAYHCQRKWLNDHKLKEGKWVLKRDKEKMPDNSGVENAFSEGEDDVDKKD
jgi:CRISPR-associated protein Csd1